MELPIPLWWLEFNSKLELQKRMKEAKPGKTNGFSQAEWENARRRHREKMNGKRTRN